jgi:arginine decarboxylase
MVELTTACGTVTPVCPVALPHIGPGIAGGNLCQRIPAFSFRLFSYVVRLVKFTLSLRTIVLDCAFSTQFFWPEATELGKDMVPKRMFFTKGVGKHRERLTSFELALRDAGIAAQNLVRVSSIFPPNCKMLARKEGVKYLSPGEVVFAVVAENSTHEAHRLLASSIGVAIPADKNTYGYLSEHHSFGETEDAAGEYAEELAAEMLATTLNVEFDPDRSWDEKKQIYRLSNKIVRTANVTQSAVGDKRGLWTTVIASAVLIFD